jgi:short-subunit dehydrogenase
VLASKVNLLVVTGRDRGRLQSTLDSLKKEAPTANIRTLLLDFSDLDSVREAAKEVNAYSEPIHVSCRRFNDTKLKRYNP